MGGQESSLPDGPAGKTLQAMTGPNRILFTDDFWSELLKVQLPGIDVAGFFDRHYNEPEHLTKRIRDAYFMQFMHTNGATGNFRTFLRIWAKLLHSYRISPRDAKPCGVAVLLSLSLFCRCLVKQFAEEFVAPELIYHFEQAPYIVERPPLTSEQALVTYCGRPVVVFPLKNATAAQVVSAFIEPVCAHFPEDVSIIHATQRCAFRAPLLSETFAAADLSGRIAEADIQDLVLCPGGVPRTMNSVVRTVFREILDFLVATSFGAVTGATPRVLANNDADKNLNRNTSTSSSALQLQSLLLEIVLALTPIISPCFGALRDREELLSRAHFSAPFFFTLRVNEALRQAVATKAEDKTQDEAPRGSVANKAEDEHQDEAPSVPLPTPPGEMPVLPFLDALQEVLEESDGRPGSVGDSSGTDEGQPPLPSSASSLDGSSGDRGAHRQGARAEAVLATLLNSIWLEPHASHLPRPPPQLIELLNGVYPSETALVDNVTEGSRSAATASKRLTVRSVIVVLLLLYNEPQAHPCIARAFSSLSDPLLEAHSNKPIHNAAAGPLNFAQLLSALLARLSEPVFPILLHCIVHRNASFRRYCLCRADVDEVLVPILSMLFQLPTEMEGATVGSPMLPPATALLLTLLAVTGDRSFCEGSSRTRLPDGSKVIGNTRQLHEVSVSSLLIVVLLRLAHWNFGACRDSFFNRAIGGIFGNLARHGVEHLHWYAADRMLELSQLLARNLLRANSRKAASGEAHEPPATPADIHRETMVRQLFREIVRLLSACLRVPLAARNCTLVYALQRVVPPQFAELETDPDFGQPLQHIHAVTDWFQAQCPPNSDSNSDNQTLLLEAAAPRLPGAVDALATSSTSFSGFQYAESVGAASYFLPVVWLEALQLVPEHVCWSRPSGRMR